jgi:hypothetical protein
VRNGRRLTHPGIISQRARQRCCISWGGLQCSSGFRSAARAHCARSLCSRAPRSRLFLCSVAPPRACTETHQHTPTYTSLQRTHHTPNTCARARASAGFWWCVRFFDLYGFQVRRVYNVRVMTLGHLSNGIAQFVHHQRLVFSIESLATDMHLFFFRRAPRDSGTRDRPRVWRRGVPPRAKPRHRRTRCVMRASQTPSAAR